MSPCPSRFKTLCPQAFRALSFLFPFPFLTLVCLPGWCFLSSFEGSVPGCPSPSLSLSPSTASSRARLPLSVRPAPLLQLRDPRARPPPPQDLAGSFVLRQLQAALEKVLADFSAAARTWRVLSSKRVNNSFQVKFVLPETFTRK